MKTCPECGYTNNDSRQSCKQCRASLYGAKTAPVAGGGFSFGKILSFLGLGFVVVVCGLMALGNLGGGRASGGSSPASSSTSPQRLPPSLQAHNFEGRNTRSTDDFRADYSPLIIDATNSGDSNFIVELRGSDGARDELVVNEIGSFRGTMVVPIELRETYHFNVDSDGRWTLKVRDLGTIGMLNESSRYTVSGRGSTVTKAFLLNAGRVNFEFDHDGESNFIVYAYSVGSDDRTLLVNEIGRLNGHSFSDRAANAIYFLAIEADGEWTATISQ